jgi:hypothetical protein
MTTVNKYVDYRKRIYNAQNRAGLIYIADSIDKDFLNGSARLSAHEFHKINLDIINRLSEIV